MKTARLLAALLSLIAGPALAQNVPANTVQGRLGIPAAGGLVQSIPIANLAPLLGIPPITNSMHGAVRVWPVPSSIPNAVGNLVGFNANGGSIGCNALSPSNCVQAAINVALPSSGAIFTQDFQRDVDIKLGYAGDHLPITWPAYQNIAARVTGTGFLDATHDSCEMCDFQYLGTQLFSLVFNPLNRGAPGGDLLFQHVDSRWFVHTVFSVQFPKASFTNNSLEIVELNADPQLVPGAPLFSVPSVAPALANFNGNFFTVHHAHSNAGHTGIYFKIGNGTPTPGLRFGNNFWNLHIDNTGSDGTQDGFVSYASKDIKIIRADGFTAGGKTVWYQSGAQDNILILQGDAANAVTTAVVDSNGSASRNLQIIGGYGIYFGGSQYMRSDSFSRFGFAYADNAINTRGTVINTTVAATDGQIPVGQTGNIPLAKSISGDATLAASGALTVTKISGVTAKRTVLAFEGDSLVAGGGVTSTPLDPYLTTNTATYDAFYASAATANYATGGITATTIDANYTTRGHLSAKTASNQDVYFYLNVGTNDVLASTAAATIYGHLQSIWAKARADGMKVIAHTVKQATPMTGPQLAILATLNASILGDATLYDYVIRMDLLFPDATYFDPDGIHITAAGYARWVAEIKRVQIGSYGQDAFIPSGYILGNNDVNPAIARGVTVANMLDGVGTTNGQVLNRSGGVWTATATPTLGIAGTTVGKTSFANATSGTVTIQPVTGALGSAVLSLPAATDTLVGKATTDTLTNKTFDTAGTGNVFKINGTTVSSVTGSGSVAVLQNTPTLTTPNIGVATATSVNKVTFTAPATSATLTLIDGTTVTGPAASGTLATLGGTNTWTGASNTVQNHLYVLGATATTYPLGVKQALNNSLAGMGLGVEKSDDDSVMVLGYRSDVGGGAFLIKPTFGSTGAYRPIIIQTTDTSRVTVDAPGNVVIGSAALATNSTDGFLYLPTTAGTPSGTPTAYTGRAALVYDSTNNKLYAYNGGWKQVALAP